MNGSYLIVVGVDGSEGGRRALEWAAQQVTCPLVVIPVPAEERHEPAEPALSG